MLSLRNLRHGITSKFPLMQITAVRGVLSEAYLCEEAWQKRLQSPLLKDLKMDLYFVEVDKKFGTKHLVSGVEIDLFANNVQDGSNLDELEHLLYRFRRTKRATEMMDSTNYAVIRAFIKFKQYDSLMRILTNREGYGVFPDLYSYNIIMSTFLNEKMYAEAARTAILMMLQEDFSNKISQALGIYSCQMFLNNCELSSLNPKEEVEENATEKQDDDEEEVQLVRVPFLRNYWFDDHFDITNPKHLIGKTFYLIGREMDHILGRSYQIIGLAMYEKWNKAAALLMTFSQSKDSTILNESVERTKAWIEEIADDDENTREKLLNKFDDIFKKMESKSLIQNGNLNTLLESYLKETLLSEKDDIEAQQKLFSVWENERKEALDRQNAELDKERRLKMIEEKKDYLFWKEKLLFFFENEDKNLEELKKVEELMEALKVHKKVQDTYEPPEIVKKAPERVSKYQRLVRVKKI
ncbi:28S ribosomal protein S27, mitochondrial-like [Argiope bruennichi]|uniref:28S ribosomal protein S27, mitochondrial-like n=1 Tax=Argiope bruennichi TaxID=94029 RepID=UPI0024959293|nr:28S ribosomal protein S27, mitochondrial-like [Argiope bruennichi]